VELDYAQVKLAFAEQCEVFLDLVDETEDLSTATALGEWDCAVLVGHVSTAVEALFRWQGIPGDELEEVDVLAWVNVGAGEMADVNADFSMRYAAKRTHQEIRDLIATAVVKGGDAVAVAAPDSALVLPVPGTWARFDQALASRVLELTIHGIDLTAAIGSSIQASPTALSVVGSILDQLLDGDRPQDLVDDSAWVPAASGRVDHPDPRLPVMR